MKAKKKYLIEWRRRQVLELISKGNNQAEISNTLHVSEATICKDLEYLKEQSKENIKKYVDEKLPNEYEKCLVGLTSILKEAWTTAKDAEDKREKIQALSLAKECYSMKLELLTNATVVEDAIRFVASESQKSKELLNLSSGNNNDEEDKESNEPDYNEDEKSDDKEGEEKQKEESGEIAINNTF